MFVFCLLRPTIQFPQLLDEKITRGRSFTKQGSWQLCQHKKLSSLICSYRFCSTLPPHLGPIKLFVRLNWEIHQGLGKIKRKGPILHPHRYPDSVPARSAQNTCLVHLYNIVQQRQQQTGNNRNSVSQNCFVTKQLPLAEPTREELLKKQWKRVSLNSSLIRIEWRETNDQCLEASQVCKEFLLMAGPYQD